MTDISKSITDKLMKKGITPVEIPYLLDDLILLFGQGNICTTNFINDELENLGWGVQVLDESLFQEIASLVSTAEISQNTQ
jgi:hypothetical protein